MDLSGFYRRLGFFLAEHLLNNRLQMTVFGATERETGLRKAEEVIQVAGMVPVNHGFNLPAKQFLGSQYQKLTVLRVDDRCGREHSRRENARSHQEIDLHLNAVLRAAMVRVSEVPFAHGMVVGAILQFVSEPGRYLFDCFHDVGAFGQHHFTFDVRDVVEIDVYGKPRQAEIEQVESGAALEDEFSAKEGVFVELSEEFAKPEDLFEVVGLKARGLCLGEKTCWIEFHVGICRFSDGASASGTMSFHMGTQRFPGRLLPR